MSDTDVTTKFASLDVVWSSEATYSKEREKVFLKRCAGQESFFGTREKYLSKPSPRVETIQECFTVGCTLYDAEDEMQLIGGLLGALIGKPKNSLPLPFIYSIFHWQRL